MIYYIIGIRRSGLHAIANWLFPMMGEYIYLNNYELGKLTDIEMVVSGNFNVIIGIENKPVHEILKYCDKGKRIWVRRDFQSVKISQYKHYSDAGFTGELIRIKLDEALELDKSYSQYLVEYDCDFQIDYSMWNKSKAYRGKISDSLNLKFNDSNKEKVFGYGVSSYK